MCAKNWLGRAEVVTPARWISLRPIELLGAAFGPPAPELVTRRGLRLGAAFGPPAVITRRGVGAEFVRAAC